MKADTRTCRPSVRPSPRPRRSRLAVLGLVAAVAVLALACGSSKNSSSGAASTTTTTAAAAAGANPTVAAATGPPNASSDVTAPLTTTTRADGSIQLVLGGHPLYRFSGDAKAGDVTGQDVGNVWYAAGADGQPVG